MERPDSHIALTTLPPGKRMVPSPCLNYDTVTSDRWETNRRKTTHSPTCIFLCRSSFRSNSLHCTRRREDSALISRILIRSSIRPQIILCTLTRWPIDSYHCHQICCVDSSLCKYLRFWMLPCRDRASLRSRTCPGICLHSLWWEYLRRFWFLWATHPRNNRCLRTWSSRSLLSTLSWSSLRRCILGYYLFTFRVYLDAKAVLLRSSFRRVELPEVEIPLVIPYQMIASLYLVAYAIFVLFQLDFLVFGHAKRFQSFPS